MYSVEDIGNFSTHPTPKIFRHPSSLYCITTQMYGVENRNFKVLCHDPIRSLTIAIERKNKTVYY